VAIATFRHSSIGFATLEQGNVLLGALAAVAVDIGMLLAAERLRDTHQNRAWLVGGLSCAALASVYSQLLYTVTHADAVAVAPGAEWMHDAAETVINLRVVIIPVLLPLLAVVYSFASRTAASSTVYTETRTATIADWRGLVASLNGDRPADYESALALLEAHNLDAPKRRTVYGWLQEVDK